MSLSYAAASRRQVRRRRHATPWQGVLAWLSLVRVHPRRAPLHALALSLGLMVVLASAVANRPTVSPASEPPEPVVASAPATELAELVAEATAPLAPATVAPQLTTYVVEPGDTLRSVAERFGVSVATLAAANKLADPDMIGIGQELVVLPASGVLHTINPGETLGQVASRYGVDTSALASVNQVASVADEPVVGEKLVVPGVEPELTQVKPKAAAARSAGPAQEQTAERVTSLASLTDGPGEAGESAAAAEKPAQNKSPLIYEVQDGDSIRSLANQFGVSVKTILLANNIDDPDLITTGTKLKVLPVEGVEHEVGKGESLADIAAAYKVDLGPIVDFNGLAEPDVIRVGDKIMIPGASAKVVVPVAAPPAPAPAPRIAPSSPASAVAALPATQSAPAAAPQAATRPAAQVAAPSIAAPAPVAVGSGSVAKIAMGYLGSRYVFGGSSPAGFDCSGFVWYVHKAAGKGISRGLWGQLNGGPRISRENLQPGDTVFFANTYMPGLSHVGIYIGGGSFIHAIDERSGVGISSMGSSYWASRYIGASRLD